MCNQLQPLEAKLQIPARGWYRKKSHLVTKTSQLYFVSLSSLFNAPSVLKLLQRDVWILNTFNHKLLPNKHVHTVHRHINNNTQLNKKKRSHFIGNSDNKVFPILLGTPWKPPLWDLSQRVLLRPWCSVQVQSYRTLCRQTGLWPLVKLKPQTCSFDPNQLWQLLQGIFNWMIIVLNSCF